jgi:peptide deformylase
MPKVLKILTLPKENKRLRQKSRPVKKDDIESPETKRLVADMIRTMQVKDGAGLAAPQIGKLIRLAVVNTKDGPLPLFNPELVKKSLAKEVTEEGCLSVPRIFGPVKRHRSVVCAYLDQDGREQKLEGSGLLARALQHELDHLDGVLFIDKLEPSRK